MLKMCPSSDVVSGDLSGRSLWDRGEHDLYVSLHELFDGEVVVFGPVPGLG